MEEQIIGVGNMVRPGEDSKMDDEEESTSKPIIPGKKQPNGDTDQGGLNEPAHMGNLNNGPREEDGEEQ